MSESMTISAENVFGPKARSTRTGASHVVRGSPVDTHDVRRPCPCVTRLRPEHVLGRDCHRLTHGHNRGVTRPGMLSQSLRPYRKRLVSSLTALGLLTKTRIKNVGVYRP